MSAFLLAVVRKDGHRVLLVPGGAGERELIQACADAIVSRGVGVFRTEAMVRAAIEAGMAEVLWAVKSEVVPDPR